MLAAHKKNPRVFYPSQILDKGKLGRCSWCLGTLFQVLKVLKVLLYLNEMSDDAGPPIPRTLHHEQAGPN